MVCDNGASVDCIIVLGSMKAAKYRVPVAAKAFFSGRSEKIMLCGDCLQSSPAIRFLLDQAALNAAIPKGNIIYFLLYSENFFQQ